MLYFHVTHRSAQMSATVGADVRNGRRRCPHRSAQMAASVGADVRIGRRRCSRGCSGLHCTNKAVGALIRGCSSLCCTNKVNGAFLRGWCTSGLLVHLRQVHPLKKIPTEANLRWDFHLYVFSDIYLTSTFLDVPSLILTTLMPF